MRGAAPIHNNKWPGAMLAAGTTGGCSLAKTFFMQMSLED
jgi:hypothetical protein